MKVRFVPQAWVQDLAVEVDPEGPDEFDVESSELRSLKPDTFESDDLRTHPNAPSWVRAWRGPFYITWGEYE